APGNAAFGRKKVLYQRILGQIALIAQAPALVAPTILLRPHAPSPRIDAHGGTESQAILPTQENSGRALNTAGVLEHGVAAGPLGMYLKFGGLDESLHSKQDLRLSVALTIA